MQVRSKFINLLLLIL